MSESNSSGNVAFVIIHAECKIDGDSGEAIQFTEKDSQLNTRECVGEQLTRLNVGLNLDTVNDQINARGGGVSIKF